MSIPFRMMVLGSSLGLGLGCWKYDASHCGSQLGDASCAEGMFCSSCEPENDGCVSTHPSADCHVEARPGETEGSSLDDSAGVMPTSTDPDVTLDGLGSGASDDGSNSTGPVPCVIDEDCTSPAAPFCNPLSGECITCAATDDPDGSCAGLDPAEPLCVNGACVQCTYASSSVCDDQGLLCDPATSTCVPCVEHAQCSSGACELAVGTCFPPGDVVHVDADGGQDFLDVAAAVASVGTGDHRVIVVHARNGELPYLGSVVVDQGRTIALFAAIGEQPVIQGVALSPGLFVAGVGTNLYVDGLELSNAASAGAIVNGALAWFDRSRIVGNDGGGIQAEDTSELVLRNSFVGGDVNDQAAIAVNSSTATILYSTVGAGFGNALALACDDEALVDARNAIFVARTDFDEIQCSNAAIEHSAAELDLGGTNTALGDMSMTWFASFSSGNFHLTAAPVTIGMTAQWEAGDPPVDIDGDVRPSVGGTADVAGADRP